jgi:hypothetical protein
MLIKLSRHYVATSQGQRRNRIWVTTDICYNVITVNTKMTMLTLHLLSSHSFPFLFFLCGSTSHSNLSLFKKNQIKGPAEVKINSSLLMYNSHPSPP